MEQQEIRQMRPQQDEIRSQTDQPHPESPTIIDETPPSQMPKTLTKIDTTPTIINETLPSQIPKSPAKIDETPVSELPQTNDQHNIITEPTQDIPHPTMEHTIDEFPTLPSKKPDPQTNTQTNTQTTLDIEDFSDDSMDQSPAIKSNKPIQTDFKRPLETTSDSEDNPNTPTLTREQRNTAIQVCGELHKYCFRNVHKLQNINMGKKRRIISTAMYIQLGDYDPSNKYVSNYSDAKTIRLYRKLTENRINVETFYLQIHNQLSKQDKPKCIKHTN